MILDRYIPIVIDDLINDPFGFFIGVLSLLPGEAEEDRSRIGEVEEESGVPVLL